MTDYDPRLVDLYDGDNPDGPDHDFYRSLADSLGAQRILDVGCGTGLLTVSLASSGRFVVGVDPSRSVIEFASRRVGGEHVQWVLGDSRAIPADGFDLAILSGNVAQHIVDPAWQRTLADIRAALRTGGVVAFETRNPLAQAWKQWAAEAPSVRETIHGRLREWTEYTEGEDGEVHLVFHNSFESTGDSVAQAETLVFRSRDRVEEQLRAAGFEVRSVWGGWHGQPFTGAEPIMVFEACAIRLPTNPQLRPQMGGKCFLYDEYLGPSATCAGAVAG